MRVARSNTILYCANWIDTVSFYRDDLGLASSFQNDWFVEFTLDGSAHLSVADAARATIDPGAGTGLTLSWQVDDLDAEMARLTSRNVATTTPIHRWGARCCFLHDPEGNRIELWQPES